MSLTSRVTFVALWVISILVVGVLASAQAQREANPAIAGADLGIRPDGLGASNAGCSSVRLQADEPRGSSTSRMMLRR